MLEGVKLDTFLTWIQMNTPLSNHVMNSLKHKNYKNIKIAYAGHIEPKMLPHILFFYERGVQFLISPCVPGIADKASFSYLESKGIPVFGQHASHWHELEDAWAAMIANNPNFVFDIGGGLIKKANQNKNKIMGGCEATSSGIDTIKKLELSFPVFNWNDIPFKNLLHNRYEVGSGLWYAFRNLTGLDLCRLNVGVIGFGLVGQSVASIAKGLGARVSVNDISPIQEMSAASEGYRTASLESILSQSDVVVTATGCQKVLSSASLSKAKQSLIIANAGHDSREIDIEGLCYIGEVLPGVGEYQLADKRIFLLAQGRLLNLAAGGGSAINTFDFVTALILRVIDWMVILGVDYPSGLHDLPENFADDLLRKSLEEIRF